MLGGGAVRLAGRLGGVGELKIVAGAAARVTENAVSGGHGPELVLVAHVAAVLVGVVAHGQLPVGPLDGRRRGGGGNAEDLVMILTHAGQQTRREVQKSATRRHFP